MPVEIATQAECPAAGLRSRPAYAAARLWHSWAPWLLLPALSLQARHQSLQSHKLQVLEAVRGGLLESTESGMWSRRSIKITQTAIRVFRPLQTGVSSMLLVNGIGPVWEGLILAATCQGSELLQPFQAPGTHQRLTARSIEDQLRSLITLCSSRRAVSLVTSLLRRSSCSCHSPSGSNSRLRGIAVSCVRCAGHKGRVQAARGVEVCGF